MEGACAGNAGCLCRMWAAAKAAAMPDWSFVSLAREQRGVRSVWIATVESNIHPGARTSVEADHPAAALAALTSRLGG